MEPNYQRLRKSTDKHLETIAHDIPPGRVGDVINGINSTIAAICNPDYSKADTPQRLLAITQDGFIIYGQPGEGGLYGAKRAAEMKAHLEAQKEEAEAALRVGRGLPSMDAKAEQALRQTRIDAIENANELLDTLAILVGTYKQ